ncbi:MAG TPA: nucleotidyltransferase domain-containing protein [Thermotogota bacterium]|nr:nucleotidyltransferase domain-containing protein [Thermotogota bacterium]
MVKNKSLIEENIRKYIVELKKHITIKMVILFGSWVNGNPDEYSDIDLAVFSPDFGKHKLKELQFLSKLAWGIDESIEAIPFSDKQLSDTNPTSFCANIIKTGEIVE